MYTKDFDIGVLFIILLVVTIPVIVFSLTFSLAYITLVIVYIISKTTGHIYPVLGIRVVYTIKMSAECLIDWINLISRLITNKKLIDKKEIMDNMGLGKTAGILVVFFLFCS